MRGRSSHHAALVWALLGGMAAAPSARAGEFDLSGHLEYQLLPQAVDGALATQAQTRLQLEVNAAADERADCAADIVYRAADGRTDFSVLDFVPDQVTRAYARRTGASVERLEQQYRLDMSDEQYVENAYLTVRLGRAQVRVGRQQLPWGTGYTWNPTDLFHRQNLLDPTYEQRGVDAVKVSTGVGTTGTATGVLAAGDDWRTSTRAARLCQHVFGYDVSVCAVDRTRLVLTGPLPTEESERRRMLGGDLSGALGPLGVWGEAAVNWPEHGARLAQTLVGADYTTYGGLYLIAEYYHNGPGATDPEDYVFADWVAAVKGMGEQLGREYLFGGASHPLAEIHEGAVYAVCNLSDRSAVVFPWVTYSLGDNTTADLVAYLPVGGERTEFGANGAGGMARVRAYF